MFEKFTDRARRVVVMAQDEARELHHNFIGTEHLLLAILREGEGVAAKILQALGVRLDEVMLEVVKIIGCGDQEPPPGTLAFTARAKKALQFTVRQADLLEHTYVGTEHILLGVIDEGEAVAARILVDMIADLPRVRELVIQQLYSRGIVASASYWQLLGLLAIADKLESSFALTSAGAGSVCFRAPKEPAPGIPELDILKILRESCGERMKVVLDVDPYGFTWATFRQESGGFETLVNSLRSLNLRLTDTGHGSSLLCSLVAFQSFEKRRLAIVYLNRRGTFYPFAPIAVECRDNELELAVRDDLEKKLPIEGDLSRWFPIWAAPPLRADGL